MSQRFGEKMGLKEIKNMLSGQCGISKNGTEGSLKEDAAIIKLSRDISLRGVKNNKRLGKMVDGIHSLARDILMDEMSSIASLAPASVEEIYIQFFGSINSVLLSTVDSVPENIRLDPASGGGSHLDQKIASEIAILSQNIHLRGVDYDNGIIPGLDALVVNLIHKISSDLTSLNVYEQIED